MLEALRRAILHVSRVWMVGSFLESFKKIKHKRKLEERRKLSLSALLYAANVSMPGLLAYSLQKELRLSNWPKMTQNTY